MSGVLVEILPMAVGVALSPVPAIVMVLVLLAPVGTRGGAALLAGRLVGLVLMVCLFRCSRSLSTVHSDRRRWRRPSGWCWGWLWLGSAW